MLKAQEIVNKQFSRAFWGYDIGEVDEFLDDIVRAYECMEQELDLAQLRIKMLLDEISRYTGKEAEKPDEPQTDSEETGKKDPSAPEAEENASVEPDAVPVEETEAEPGETENGGTVFSAAEEATAANDNDEEATNEQNKEEETMKVTIRYAVPEDVKAITAVEAACFPPAEAATEDRFEARVKGFSKNFWVAEAEGKVIGIINGMCTDRRTIVDEMFADAGMHDDEGDWQSVMGIAVLPEYQRQGIAAKLMETLIEDAREHGRKGCTLTCKDRLIHYYAKFGYVEEGISESEHGGAVWYDMILEF
ncbi:MAG: GNAT family N-acetyltransferase [Clostridiales bacterium]|nr:GNAT family N-acetyltransferase [Clostridiales bacterium]